jgi:hypothetical protein
MGYLALDGAIAGIGGWSAWSAATVANGLHHSVTALTEAGLTQLGQVFAENSTQASFTVFGILGATALGMILPTKQAFSHRQQARNDRFDIAELRAQMNAQSAGVELPL